MAVYFEKMTAEIDLMDNLKMYVVKDGQLYRDELPKLVEEFGLSFTQASRYGKLEDYLIEEQIQSQREYYKCEHMFLYRKEALTNP